jgi:hypothetical protein
MFFVKFESLQRKFSPSYSVLESEVTDDALQAFASVLQPFAVEVQDAVLICILYEAGSKMGEEVEVSRLTVLSPSLPSWESSYKHPQDYTVWHEESEPLPQGLLTELETLAIWEAFSFPNGSNYRQQKLPRGTFTLPNFGEVKIEYGYEVRIGWDVWKVSNARIDVGRGVNLGVHFNSRDQALAVFKE